MPSGAHGIVRGVATVHHPAVNTEQLMGENPGNMKETGPHMKWSHGA